MISLRRYTPADKKEWDRLAAGSKNGTFLHLRDYMDYHADRFEDFSIMSYNNGKLCALLPACAVGKDWISHAGLTYGGLLMDDKCTATMVLEIFRQLRTMLSTHDFDAIIYSPSPHIYHRVPAEEDLYALFRQNATLTARKISSAILQEDPLKWRYTRKSGIRKAENAGITVEENEDFAGFWKILEDNLSARYDARPVHSLEEIQRLKSLFPDNISLHTATKNGEIVAGAVIYKMQTVAHCQYISSTPEGKRDSALDLLFHHLLMKVYAGVRWFDFGTSNEDGGRLLNESLIFQKEGFGGRAICYDTYTIRM